MKFKKLNIGMDQNEFIMFVLLLRNYRESLWIEREDGYSMLKYDQWADVAVSFLKKEIRLADWVELEDGIHSFPGMWDFFRNFFKESTEKEAIEYAKNMFNRWGDLQRGIK